MATLTLLVKASNSGQLKQVDDLLKSEFENLDLDVKVLGTPVNKWVQVFLSGEDEVIATSYINKNIGTCPINIKKVSKFSVLKGYISKVDIDNAELKVDVGIFEPKIIQATIPLAYLQAQLADGRKVDLKKIIDAYGFHVNLPLNIKAVSLNGEGDKLLQAELSTEARPCARSERRTVAQAPLAFPLKRARGPVVGATLNRFVSFRPVGPQQVGAA